MVQNFDLDDFNMIDFKTKRVIETLSQFGKGELVKGDVIHKQTGLLPSEINDAVRSLAKSLLVDVPEPLRNSPPYNFYAVEITDFGRQVLEQFG
jgi:hypothetical protein